MHYQTLSLVSKRFRSLLASTELYQTRTLLGCTEICLYVCLKRQNANTPECWFTLCLTPNSSKKVLVPITSPTHYPFTDMVSVGSNIYAIGGLITRVEGCSRVMVMDCYSNTWREAPSMRMARGSPSSCVLDGKIYVTGGCDEQDASNWMEVFDTKTQTWEFLLSGNSEKVSNGYWFQSIGYEGTVYVQDHLTDFVHKLDKDGWREGDLFLILKWIWSSSACVIDNVMYCCSHGKIYWYDSETKYWKRVKGLGRSSFASRPDCEAKLADSGGKLAICWEEIVLVDGVHQEIKIWCGEIAIVKRQKGMIRGKLEWSDIVLTTNTPFEVAHVLAVTLW